MVDIHAHILPEIDDGSESMEDSIQMAKIAWHSGVGTIVVTPHCNVDEKFQNYYDDFLRNRFKEFVNLMEKEHIPIQFILGMEVYATEEVPILLQKEKIITLNHSRYLLLEFSFRKDIPLMEFLIEEITSQGLHIIIAHPERYPYVQKQPEIVYNWLESGCSLQVNKGSILGSFGCSARNTSLYLLEHNLVSFVASDAHSPTFRNMDMSEVNNFLENYFSKEYADILLEMNPKRVVENKELIKF